MKDHRKALFIAAALIGFGVCSAHAAHKDVKHCADDYRKFCHAWGLETKGLENCMRKHGDKLTNACVAALVKTGNVSQAEVNSPEKNARQLRNQNPQSLGPLETNLGMLAMLLAMRRA